MPNIQATQQISAALLTIERRQQALKWLEDSREAYQFPKSGKERPPQFSLDQLNQWGRGVSGFEPAAALMNAWLRDNQVSMLNAAIQQARDDIRSATERIKDASDRL